MRFFDDFNKILQDSKKTIKNEVKSEIENKLKKVQLKPVSNYILPYMNVQNVDNILVDMEGKDLKVNDITDELKATLIDSSNGVNKYPKVFTKGISAHGYPGTGMHSAAVISLSTETIRNVGGLAASRMYGGCFCDPSMEVGYTFGGEVKDATKFNGASETSSNVTFGQSLTSAICATGSYTKNKKAMAMLNGQNWEVDTSNETASSGISNISVIRGYVTVGAFADYYNENNYLPNDGSYPSGFIKRNANTGTYKSIGTGNMKAHDQGGTSYINKVIVETGNNSDRSRKFFFFTTETFVATTPSINNTGETQYASCGGVNYSLGGYNAGSGGQHNRGEKTDVETGTCVNIGTTAYRMSSASHYAH